MKNVFSASSLNSLNSDYNVWQPSSSHNNSSRRAMLPIRELDFESRIMFNCKLPKKKPYSEHLRKNDFVVDLNEYNNRFNNQNDSNDDDEHHHHNQQQQPLILKSLKNCFSNNSSGVAECPEDESLSNQNYYLDQNEELSNNAASNKESPVEIRPTSLLNRSKAGRPNQLNLSHDTNNVPSFILSNHKYESFLLNSERKTNSIMMKQINRNLNNHLERDIESTATNQRIKKYTRNNTSSNAPSLNENSTYLGNNEQSNVKNNSETSDQNTSLTSKKIFT
jgi:hypothetical protein